MSGMSQSWFPFAQGGELPQGCRRREHKRRNRRFLEVAEAVMRFLMRRDARRDLRRVVQEMRVLCVLVKGEADTVAIADALRADTRATLDWLDMAADDGYILECGRHKDAKRRGGKAKVWRIAPDGVALLKEALRAFGGQL